MSFVAISPDDSHAKLLHTEESRLCAADSISRSVCRFVEKGNLTLPSIVS